MRKFVALAFAASSLFGVVTPASAQVIQACADKQGLMRLMSSSGCKMGETALSWNRIGPIGPIGPQGPAGPTGASGPQGPVGQTGATGPTGPVGQTGAAGPTGPQGPQGVAGLPGPTGPQGPVGPAGQPAPVYTAVLGNKVLLPNANILVLRMPSTGTYQIHATARLAMIPGATGPVPKIDCWIFVGAETAVAVASARFHERATSYTMTGFYTPPQGSETFDARMHCGFEQGIDNTPGLIEAHTTLTTMSFTPVGIAAAP
jgi:hypothetical protein